MTAIPDAAIAEIAAALDDYQRTTPVHRQTPRRAAEHAARYLTTSGWGIYVPHSTQTQRPRAACPACTVKHLITQNGRIRRHGPHSNPCPGSGAPAFQPAA